jgi:adenylate cyclase
MSQVAAPRNSRFAAFWRSLLAHPQLLRPAVLLLAGLLTLLVLGLFRAPLATLEEQVGAMAWRVAPDATPEERINIIQIDEKSIDALGAWPWPRETMARLSAALSASGVQLQIYDIIFPETRPGDEAFVAALGNSRAVLAQLPDIQTEQNTRTGLLTHALSGADCSASGLATAGSYIANHAAFAGIAKGHIAPVLDGDGAVRQVPALICVEDQAYPALSLMALLQGIGIEGSSVLLNPGRGLLAPARTLEFSAYPGLQLPLDAQGNLRVSFRRAPEAWRGFSAVDVIEGRIDPELLEGTWALVGYTAFGLVDIVPTPFNAAASGVEIQARVLASLLDNELPYTPAAAPLLLALLSLAFAGLLYLATRRQERSGYIVAACALLFPLLTLGLHIQLLLSANLWLGWLAPALYGLLAASLLLVHEYARVRFERSRVLHNFSSYLPSDVARELAYALPNSSISARRQSVTLLCADLRNFSAYSEARPPEESAALLHFFFVRATELVEQHQGQVHEFKGDSLLAVWPGSDEAAATQALRTAQALQLAMRDVLPASTPDGLEALALGIGIEQGPVLIGSIGPAQRRTHTLLGETVTIVLRIQAMTMDLAQPILIGECAARQLPDQQLQSQGSYLLDGLQTPHTLFAPPQARAAKADALQLKVLQGGRA